MALLSARCFLMVTIWLCATLTVFAELCNDQMPGCSFYTQDCEFMWRLCPWTCGYCLANSETHNPSTLNVDDSEPDEIPGTDPGSPPEGRHIGRIARALSGTDPGSPPEGSHTGRTASALSGIDPGSPPEDRHTERTARALHGTDPRLPPDGSHTGITATALLRSGWNPSVPRSLSVGNPATPLPSLGRDSSAAKEVQSIVADAFSHLHNVTDDDSLRDGLERYDEFLPTEVYKPLSYNDVINNNYQEGAEFRAGQLDEVEYNFVYEEGEGNFDIRGTSKNNPVDLKLLDIDYLRKTGLLGGEIQGRNKIIQGSLAPEEWKIIELLVDQYKNLEESDRVFNVSDDLEESTDKLIKFYESGSSPAFSEFLYRLFTNISSTGRYDDYFSESEEQVANFIDAIVTFDVNNLRRSI